MAVKRYSLMRCRTCGFPRLVSLFVRWNDNGTITQLMQKNFRVVILHFGFIDNLFANIEARLGVSIEHIAFEAQRNASKAVFEAIYDRVPGSRPFVRKFNFAKRLGVEQFNKVATITGQCFSETLEYFPYEKGKARIKNPFNLNLMAANVVGAFEILEGLPYTHSWTEEGKDSYIISIEREREKPEISERMSVEFQEILPGNRKFERCPRCKAPSALTYLKWLENEGVILDTRTGARVVILDGYMVNTVFREMSKELGAEVDQLLVDAQREWTLEHVEQLGLTKGVGLEEAGKLETSYRAYIDTMPLYGQGNPVSFEMGDSGIRVVVENPYEPYILAGTLQGLYEALQKRESRVDWEKLRPGAIAYTVEPVS